MNGFVAAEPPPPEPFVAPSGYVAPESIHPTVQYATPPTTSPRCDSDYSCQYGEACVKASYEAMGICATKVNQYGNPTYSPPDAGSVRSGGSGSCGFDTDCPIGFKCAKQNYASRGSCMK
jgi:hypothetical protein